MLLKTLTNERSQISLYKGLSKYDFHDNLKDETLEKLQLPFELTGEMFSGTECFGDGCE
jgi:hypothetical protein